MTNRIVIVLCLVMAFLASGCALPKNVKWKEIPGIEVPQVQRVVSYYPELDTCMREVLFAGRAPETIMIVIGRDATGTNDYWTGKFLPQDFSSYIIHPLQQNGENLVIMDGTIVARSVIEWMKQNAGKQDGSFIPWQAPPGVNYMLFVEAVGLSFKKGFSAEATVFKAGGGIRSYGAQIAMSGRLVHRSGQVVASNIFKKEIPGIAAYIGTGGVIEGMLVNVKIEAGEHEAFNNGIYSLAHIVGYDIAAQLYGERACDKYAKGIFNGMPQRNGEPPYKRFEKKVAQLPPAMPVEEKTVKPVAPPICPLEAGKDEVVAVLYNGHNDATFDPKNNPQQKQAMNRIVELWQKGCDLKRIEGARCPKTGLPGVMLARASKPADYLAQGSNGKLKPLAIEMPPDKLKALHAQCQKPTCDEDTYPWFYAGYAIIGRSEK